MTLQISISAKIAVLGDRVARYYTQVLTVVVAFEAKTR